MRSADLPLVEPRWSARPLAPSEVLRLANGEPVPGIDPADPRVQAIRRCTLDNLGRLAIRQARERGFLWLNATVESGDAARLKDLWSWWCAAARQPEVVVSVDARTDSVRVTCDASPSGRDLTPAVLAWIGRALVESNQHGGWIATPDVIEVDGLDTESALTLVEQLLAALSRA